MKRIGVVAILVLAFAGLADSAYITQHVIRGTPLICNVQNLSDCNTVAASQYSRVFGIPLAEYGVFFYGVLFILAALELVLFDQILRRFLQGVSLVGVVASFYFTMLQVFFIHAFCIYCSASAIISVLVLICATSIESIRKNKITSPPAPPHLSMPPTA